MNNNRCRFFRAIVLFLSAFIVACSADIDDYSQSGPEFQLFDYFSGQHTAWGMIQDYRLKQTRRFEVALRGEVKGEELTLHEDFVFDDGETMTRVWRITRQSDGHYLGQADDIVGTALGREQGNALHWQYDFLIEQDGSKTQVTFDDWLYRQDEKHVFNVTSIRKWGIEVGRLTLFFQKHD
ncbi:MULTISPECIES: DUF3833 domain-containing protein [unclassified Vibrio]|uniref:DUF3833 domain-containing protein n=1 Tax=Vibrio sp. HB236076 TaxID=3232307 RepID=A0AB39HE75_9VIBR|nr:DUF3833 domain-containing protein [Vibrio sp. HB161653]MDP5253649.1 DUF3833 domain-containing protein [Vibrio sp. HB161653]